MVGSPEQSFLDAIRNSGICPPDSIIADGRLHRFRSFENKKEQDGFYTFFPDDPASGVYGCWKRNIKEKWCSRTGGESSLSEAERRVVQERIEKAKQQREAEKRMTQSKAAKTASLIWSQGVEPTQEFPYLKNKGISAHGTRLTKQNEKYPEQSLIVPVWNVTPQNGKGELTSLQFIRQDGSKSFLGGGSVQGGFFHIGKLVNATIIVCEGFATGASIHEATGLLVVVAFNASNLVNVAQIIRERYETAKIIIAADDDWKTDGNPGIDHAEKAAESIGGLVALPKFGRNRKDSDTDFNDLHKSESLDAVKRCIDLAVSHDQLHSVLDAPVEEADSVESWRDRLIAVETKDGRLNYTKNLANVAVVLEHHPEWRGVLAYDEFNHCVVALSCPPSHRNNSEPKAYPHQWLDIDDTLATIWLQQEHPFVGSDTNTTFRAAETVAQKQKIHPVRNYLTSLVWDKKPRLDSWLKDFLGCRPEDDEGNYDQELDRYLSAVGSKWLISAVARIFEPGCKADACLVLEGEQGLGKSTALKTLFGTTWFTDQIADIGSKDADMQLEGAWCVEFGELDAISRHESSRVKAFISRTFERYVKKWAKRAERTERQCVFSGTVNGSGYFKDETGNRRYWPVLCRNIDQEGISENKDQIWAEAVARFKNKENHYLSPEDEIQAKAEQSKRMIEDSWEIPVEAFLSGHERVTIPMILKSALNLSADKWGQREQNRIVNVMKRLGWIRRQVRLKPGEASRYGLPEKPGERQWIYEKQDLSPV